MIRPRFRALQEKSGDVTRRLQANPEPEFSAWPRCPLTTVVSTGRRNTESFLATLEKELLNRRRFKTQVEAKMAVFEWLEVWYNPHRRHSSLGRISPINFERKQLAQKAA